MQTQDNARVEIYQVLDGVIGNGVVPPGSRGKIFAVVDRLRHEDAGGEDLSLAEQVSLGLYRLEQALNRAERCEVDVAKHALRSLAAQWLDRRIKA